VSVLFVPLVDNAVVPNKNIWGQAFLSAGCLAEPPSVRQIETNMCQRREMIMKKSVIIFLLSFGVQSILLSNPIHVTPAELFFSELVFDNSDNWTLEVGKRSFWMSYDSVIFITTNSKAKLKGLYPSNSLIFLITSDSLTTPLLLNREGDKIVINTYSTNSSDSTIKFVMSNSISYGDYPGASVGKPISGYSIMRVGYQYSLNGMTIDCLTKYPSLGVANDTLNLSGILKGHVYDSNNKPVTKLKLFPAQSYFVLETPLVIDSNGAYSTSIFPTICSPTKLIVRFVDFIGSSDSVQIEPFGLNDIHPDTVVLQDIHLKDDRYVATSVNNKLSTINNELIIMNYPNPFNLSTNFFVKVPDKLKNKAGEITIVNIAGQLIRNISLKESQLATWDGKDSGGTIMPSGVYFYRLAINKQVMKTGSMILLK
jgi:hypothetical protein